MGKARRRASRGLKASEPPMEEAAAAAMEEPGAALRVTEEADDFQEGRLEEAVLGALGSEEEEEEEGEEEEVLGLELSEEEEEEDGEGMESDLEEPRRGSGLPDELAWGQRKQLYYGSDYGKGPKKKRKEEAEEEDQEEEEEAQAIRRRLAENLGEDDFGLDLVEAFAGAAGEEEEEEESGRKIDKDLGSLSRKERMKLLRKESPELSELIRDFEAKMTELRDELEPLARLARDGAVPEGRGREYLQTKYHLYLNYCCNISFYLVLKAKRVPVHGHPVIERLVTYRNLINDLGAVDRKLSTEIRLLLNESRNPSGQKKGQAAKRKRVDKPETVCEVPNGKADEEPTDDSELDEQAALNYYKEMEEKLKKKRRRREEMEDEGKPVMEEEAPGEKRSATYQIVKNKGLTPKRKKIDRNPRVKHREKFRRAKVRRKGQVREVRREEQRYGGELSGIRAGVKKSIKLK